MSWTGVVSLQRGAKALPVLDKVHEKVLRAVSIAAPLPSMYARRGRDSGSVRGRTSSVRNPERPGPEPDPPYAGWVSLGVVRCVNDRTRRAGGTV